MEPLRAVADEFGLPLIADAAAALGATYRSAPGAHLADLAVFSFNGNKTFTCGGGGAITGRRVDWLALARHLSTTARRGADYDHDAVGFNYRMTNLEAAVGCAQLERLPEFLAAKRRIDRTYRDAFAGLPGVEFFPAAPWNESACWFSGIVVRGGDPNPVPGLIRALQAAGIGARNFWKPLHRQNPYADGVRMEMPFTDDLWDRVLTLPCSTGITEEELHRTVAAVRTVLI
jgi:dTDP-4-amino-4,6-dideoxygalactose transaminase